MTSFLPSETAQRPEHRQIPACLAWASRVSDSSGLVRLRRLTVLVGRGSMAVA